MILFGFFEGQGRILLGYNPLARVLFDILLILGIARVFIKEKRFFSLHSMPPLIFRFMILHFIWWVIELFNPIGPGPLASFATAKYYIFPFFLFFAMTLKPIDIKSRFFQNFIIILLIVTALECALCIHQMSLGSEFMGKISGNYNSLFKKFENFTGFFFRPWGTTHAPGSASLLLYLSLPLCFFVDFDQYKTKKGKSLIIIGVIFVILLSWFALFISQVRSAWIKHILITFTYSFIYFAISPNKLKLTIRSIALTLIFGTVLSVFSGSFKKVEKDLNLTSAFGRIAELEKSNLQDHRSGFMTAATYAMEKVVFPLGYGTGMCTGFLPQFEKQRRSLLEFAHDDFWALDNLYVFLTLELGIGALFYLGSVFSIIIFISIRALVLFRRAKFNEVRILVPVLSVFYILIIGNWGAIALPFNPESFYFWIYASIGVTTAFYRKDSETEEIPMDEDSYDKIQGIKSA